MRLRVRSPSGGLHHPSSGVTLIELVIVLVILGVLAGIAVLSYETFAAAGDAEVVRLVGPNPDEEDGGLLREVDDRRQAAAASGATPSGLLPEEPPRVDRLELTPDDNDLLVGDDASITASAEFSNGVSGPIEILLEVEGANEATILVHPGDPLTIGYTGTMAGIDVIQACTGYFGQAPQSCDPGEPGLKFSEEVERTWWTRPTVDEARVGDVDEGQVESVVVTWDQNVTLAPSGSPTDYRFYSHDSCGFWSSLGTGVARTSGSSGSVEIALDLPWWATWNEDDAGWLRVDANTEQNGGQFGNEQVDCVEIDP